MNSSMKFFNGTVTRNKNPPTNNGNSDSTSYAPTLEDINGTTWQTSSAKDASKMSRSSKDKSISRRSSVDASPTRQRSKDKHKPIVRSNSEHQASQTKSNHGRRLTTSDPPSSGNAFSNGQRKDESTKEKRKKKKQQDAPQEGGRGGLLSNSCPADFLESDHNKSVRDASFQDVLKNLGEKTSDAGAINENKQEDNPFVVPPSSRSPPRSSLTPVEEDPKNSKKKLDLSGFKSTKDNDNTSALTALLGNANFNTNFSSDCSVGTINTTTQCALSLGHLIEEMQTEFQKLKKQKNKAESYAEKLHTDYVRMQEGLEREYEKACYERDELKIAREKDSMAIDKLKEEIKALKAENSGLKESMVAMEEKSMKAEEENGRMKIALEALLVRSGAMKKDGKTKEDGGGAGRAKKDRISKSDRLDDSIGRSAKSSIQMNTKPASLQNSPHFESREQLVYPYSADCVKSYEPLENYKPKKNITLPFEPMGNQEVRNGFTSSERDVLNNYFNRGDDDNTASDDSNGTKDDDSLNTPTPC